jgi:hypothetical protein
MGNRAYVVFTREREKQISPAVYLHNNGGPESVYAFLHELRRRHVGIGLQHVSFVAARLCHVVGDFFDDTDAGATRCSIGVEDGPPEISAFGVTDLADTADDNGVYVVNIDDHGKWTVRRFVPGGPDGLARELTKHEVDRERREACKHVYVTGRRDDGEKVETIHEAFLRLRPKVSESG